MTTDRTMTPEALRAAADTIEDVHPGNKAYADQANFYRTVADLLVRLEPAGELDTDLTAITWLEVKDWDEVASGDRLTYEGALGTVYVHRSHDYVHLPGTSKLDIEPDVVKHVDFYPDAPHGPTGVWRYEFTTPLGGGSGEHEEPTVPPGFRRPEGGNAALAGRTVTINGTAVSEIIRYLWGPDWVEHDGHRGWVTSALNAARRAQTTEGEKK